MALTLGGPIQSNKTFFFADWQGTRLRTGMTRFSVVPTLAQRQGIFSQADLRSRNLAAHSVSRQHDTSRADSIPIGASDPAALSAA